MKKTTRDVIFIVGLLLIILDIFVIDTLHQNGMLVVPEWGNFATLFYDLCYWFGLLFVGIIGLIMVIFSGRFYRD